MFNKRIQKNEFVDISMNRKGQGISINVVIIAAIALLVLVILSVLLIRSGGELVIDCSDVSGECKSDCSVANFETKYSAAICENEEEVCCIPLKR